MAPHNLASGNQMRGLAWHPRLAHFGSNNHHPYVLVALGNLHREVGDAGRLRDAAHGLNRSLAVFGQARWFRIRAKRILLHHP